MFAVRLLQSIASNFDLDILFASRHDGNEIRVQQLTMTSLLKMKSLPRNEEAGTTLTMRTKYESASP
jgi:hypothetical protein